MAPGYDKQASMPLVVALSTVWALLWLTYRAWQVFQKPVPELIEKLALDIPPAPDLVLECIQPTEIKITWKQPDAQNSTTKYGVYINDAKVGESKRVETGITIFNLEPSTRYTIRVFAVSHSNHQTPSAFVGVQTSALDDPSTPPPKNSFPRIRAFVPAQGNALPISAPAMAREHSGGQPHGRRATTGRRPSPASAQDNLPNAQSDEYMGEVDRTSAGESLGHLAEQLRLIQEKTEELEKELAEEELAHQAQMDSAMKERDKVRRDWKEREEASSDLKKHVANLDRENRNAQNKKNAKEKLLKQKEDEREKHRQDIGRWKKEIGEMRTERARLQSETVENEKRAAERVQEIRDQISELQLETKSIEEENRVKTAELKVLEEERNSVLSGADNEEAKEFDRLERDRDREWEMKLQSLQLRSSQLIGKFHQAQVACQEAERHLSILTNRRSSISAVMGPIPQLEMDPVRRNSKRRNRHRSSLASNISSPTGSFPLTDQGIPTAGSFATSSNISPTFPGGAAFFNFSSGMTLPPTDGSPPSQADMEVLTGGAPMSPRADSLLPSDLLGDEEPSSSSPIHTLHTSMSGMGPFNAPVDNHHSYSPVSSSSRPGSIFSSPRESTHNLPDADQASINSGQLSFHQMKPTTSAQTATSRLSSFFSTNRQRGKTLDDEPPMLGSLKAGQSQSFPRNLDAFDPVTRRRRGSHTGTSWAFSNIWPRGSGAAGGSTISSNQMPSALKRFPGLFQPKSGSLTSLKSDLNSGYNQFSPRLEPIDPSGFPTLRGESSSPSSRPMSTYSAENPLPRPSMDSQSRFGWPIFDKAGQRNSPLGPDWSSPPPFSRNQSRRPSFQYGSTSNLSLIGPQEVTDIIENPDDPNKLPLQAPIGTRPKSSQRPQTPKLNPAAPAFKFFSGMAKKKDAEKTPEITAEDASPPDSRLSRDSHSITTAESHDPLERTPSGTPSDTAPIQKETLMQKITRKSSSSKFNIPWKDKLSKKGEPSTPGEIDEDEASASDAQLGKSVDSIPSTPSGDKEKAPRTSLSFRNFTLRKTKKVDTTASESSERASETGDEEMTEEE